eukprot:CAMPEP_0115577668 /NCGR_PEP_ID=MMETSP0272-20121206/3190_1 /TAXON_ID=71861 /ORGANISM="Scrippsiella trochoidea, Strain CCMP3099" /LENGTH=196 /DNA_ID=CAMNT_0003012485 /DNA_START=576 /DNA_END=1164 /DNA_ORIENTATION=-
MFGERMAPNAALDNAKQNIMTASKHLSEFSVSKAALHTEATSSKMFALTLPLRAAAILPTKAAACGPRLMVYVTQNGLASQACYAQGLGSVAQQSALRVPTAQEFARRDSEAGLLLLLLHPAETVASALWGWTQSQPLQTEGVEVMVSRIPSIPGGGICGIVGARHTNTDVSEFWSAEAGGIGPPTHNVRLRRGWL